MERRAFLKGLVAAALLPSLPLAELAPVPQRYVTLLELARMTPAPDAGWIAALTEQNALLELLSFKEIHGS